MLCMCAHSSSNLLLKFQSLASTAALKGFERCDSFCRSAQRQGGRCPSRTCHLARPHSKTHSAVENDSTIVNGSKRQRMQTNANSADLSRVDFTGFGSRASFPRAQEDLWRPVEVAGHWPPSTRYSRWRL